MKRSRFLQTLPLLTIGATADMNIIKQLSQSASTDEVMPVLFLGHGSPMNAIEENEFVKGFRNEAAKISLPKAIICVSAHWETRGTLVTAMEKPQTIHDFGGFPRELYQVQYPAPGSPELAQEVIEIVKQSEVGLDHKWGFDHGSWSVVKHLYPNADIPMIQMSLDYTKSPRAHYELASELASLRRKGVLIIGSGNMVHNLRMVAWDKLGTPGFGYDWAIEANDRMKQLILGGDHDALVDFRAQGKAFDLAIPTPDHYLPLLYALALRQKNEEVALFNDQALGGSLTMTSVRIG